jgi:hypothetical protein
MTIAWVCIELRLLVPNVISDSCVLAQFNAVGFVLYILSYYYLYFLCPCCGVRYNFRKRLFCWSLSLLFVVQFMSYCDVCLRILVSNIMPYRLLVSNIMPYRILVSNIMPYRILVSNIMPYRTLLSNIMPYRILVSNIMPYRTGVLKWAGTRYFYPPEIVYSTGRNYWTPPPKKKKLAVVKTTSTMVDRLVEYFS